MTVPVVVVPSPQLIVAVNRLAVAFGLASVTVAISLLCDWFWPIVIVVPPALTAASATVTAMVRVLPPGLHPRVGGNCRIARAID
jgi:hypothetical protein